jgi:hypothetical protein
VLVAPKPGRPFILTTDASSYGVGAILQQGGRLVGCFSRKLADAETRYSATDREALAVVRALAHFRTTVLGSPVTIQTDHKPLLGWFQKPPTCDRQARWMLQIQDYDCVFRHLPGADNVIADVLSREGAASIAVALQDDQNPMMERQTRNSSPPVEKLEHQYSK